MEIRKVDIAILTVIPQELTAVKAALNIHDIPVNRSKTKDSQTIYLHGELFSERTKKTYSLALGCIGNAGNYNSSQATTEVIQTYNPQLVILVGIAAGIKGKAKLGEVVFSERIVGYESASLRQLNDGTKVEQPRPDMPSVPNGIFQDVTFYLATDKDRLSNNKQRLKASFLRTGGDFPVLCVDEQSHVQKEDIIDEIELDVCAIASGEKLLKDPSILENIRDNQHGRVKVGEMEAIGLATACQRMRRDWLVIRGISDFGDAYKSDVFHPLASQTAATVLADFIQYGLEREYSQESGKAIVQKPKEQVLKLLKNLLPSQFDEVLFKCGVDLAHLANGSQNQKSIDLIRYVIQKEGEDLSQLLTVIYKVVPHMMER